MLRSIVTQLPFFLCLFWALFFFLQSSKSRLNNRVLGLFMFFSSMMHLSYCVFFGRDVNLYLYFDWLFLFSSLLIVPTFYLYFTTIARASSYQYRSLYHYLPAVVFILVYATVFISASATERIDYLNTFMYARQKPVLDIQNKAHQLNIIFLLNRSVFLLQTIFYSVIFFKVIKQYRARIKNIYSNTEGKELSWLNSISVCILLLVVMGAVFNTLGRELFYSNDFLLAIPSLFYATILYFIAYTSYRSDFSVYDLELEESNILEVDSAIVPACSASDIGIRLEQLMHDKKLFLASDLRITAICKELNTNRTYLSQVLNDEMNENFNSFVNKFRVNHAISILADTTNKHYSLEQICELSGFGSTVSMLRAFKQTAGKTPSEYRK